MEQVEILYKKPKWYNIIYDPTYEKSGEVLLSYALIDKKISAEIPDEQIRPRFKDRILHLFMIGLRDIDKDHP
jgi:hypothetical protein